MLISLTAEESDENVSRILVVSLNTGSPAAELSRPNMLLLKYVDKC